MYSDWTISYRPYGPNFHSFVIYGLLYWTHITKTKVTHEFQQNMNVLHEISFLSYSAVFRKKIGNSFEEQSLTNKPSSGKAVTSFCMSNSMIAFVKPQNQKQ